MNFGEGNGTPLQYSCLENPMDGEAWKAAVHGVAEGRTRLSDFTSTFHFHALEKEMATHSSVLAWRIPGMGEPCGLPSMGLHRVRHDWSDLATVWILKFVIFHKVCFKKGTYFLEFLISRKNIFCVVTGAICQMLISNELWAEMVCFNSNTEHLVADASPTYRARWPPSRQLLFCQLEKLSYEHPESSS